MKTTISHIFKQVIADRPVLLMILATFVATIIYIVYVSLSLSPTDSQIATRYTAFGVTHFYRNQWFYLFNFVGFGLLVGLLHAAVIAKLHDLNMRSLAIAFGWLTLITIIIVGIITHAILSGIAYLS